MRLGSYAVFTACALLVLTGTAAAAGLRHATNQEIYGDLADNGKLDRNYLAADIKRALHTPLKGYEAPVRIRRPQRNRTPEQVSPAPLSVERARGAVPFSGLDLAFLGGVGGPLLLAGASVRLLARVRAQS